MELDLEADLGIDTVKQAETFAAVRETFGIPLQEGINLRDYPTLAAVANFVRTMRPDLAAAAPAPVVAAPAPAAPAQSTNQPINQPPAADPITTRVLALVAAKTGYPEEMLELELDMEADLGIDTVKQAETFAAIREAFAIPLQEGINLRDYPTLAAVVNFVHTMRPDLAVAPAPAAQSTNQPIHQSTPAPAPVHTTYSVEDADKMPRRVPTPLLRPALEFCQSTGVTLAKAAGWWSCSTTAAWARSW